MGKVTEGAGIIGTRVQHGLICLGLFGISRGIVIEAVAD
jgi:hypothetical protein